MSVFRRQGSAGRGGGGRPPPARVPGRCLRPAPARSPRVSSGAASTSSCKGSALAGCRSLSSPPTGSPHLARQPPAPPPKRAPPLHACTRSRTSRSCSMVALPRARRPRNLPPGGRRRPPATGGARRGWRRGDAAAAGPGQPIRGALKRQPMGGVTSSRRAAALGGARRTARRGRRRRRRRLRAR